MKLSHVVQTLVQDVKLSSNSQVQILLHTFSFALLNICNRGLFKLLLQYVCWCCWNKWAHSDATTYSRCKDFKGLWNFMNSCAQSKAIVWCLANCFLNWLKSTMSTKGMWTAICSPWVRTSLVQKSTEIVNIPSGTEDLYNRIVLCEYNRCYSSQQP